MIRDVYVRELGDGKDWYGEVRAEFVPSRSLGWIGVTGFHQEASEDPGFDFPVAVVGVTREELIESAILVRDALRQWGTQLTAGHRPTEARQGLRRAKRAILGEAEPEPAKTPSKQPAPTEKPANQQGCTLNPDGKTYSVPPHLLRSPPSSNPRAQKWTQVPRADQFVSDPSWRGRKVEELELGPYPRGRLLAAGIRRLGQLQDFTEADLAQIQGIGTDTARAILTTINQYVAWEGSGKKVTRARDRNPNPAKTKAKPKELF